MMLSRTDIVGTMPSALRSSGSSTVPAASDARGEPVRTRRPRTSTLPPSIRCVPKIARTVSDRPEPSRPASPSTSPAWTESETSCSWLRRCRPTASRTTSSRTCWLRSKLVRPSERTSATPRPSIVAITSSLVVSLISDVRVRRPSRRIVIRSAMANTSSRLWLTNSRATPAARNRRIISNTWATSRGSSDDVGSSRITTRASVDTARTMAIICCTPAPNERTGRRTSMSMPWRRSSAPALRFISLTPSRPHRPRGSLPRYRLRATDISGTSVISWNVVLMPMSHASRGDDGATVSPPIRDLPLVGVVHAREDLDQGRLAGTVLPDEGVHLPGDEVDADLVEGGDPAEPLRDPDRPEYRLHQSVIRSARPLDQ